MYYAASASSPGGGRGFFGGRFEKEQSEAAAARLQGDGDQSIYEIRGRSCHSLGRSKDAFDNTNKRSTSQIDC
jgi:superfamily I DNA/RNA helicase